MNRQLPLIVGEAPVHRGLLAVTQPTTPSRAVVYATAAGELTSFDGRPMRWSQQALSPYRTRYDVDISDHRRTAELRSTPLPSRGDVYFFVATVDVGFRVHDPVEIVRRNVADALPIVYGALVDRFIPITRSFAIEESARAEAEIRRRFGAGWVLPEGITIFALSPRLLPDADASAYLRAKVAAARELEVGQARHEVEVQQAQQRGQLDQMAQRHQIQAARTELAELGERPLTPTELIRLHLARNPQDTTLAMQLLTQHDQAVRQHQDAHNERSMELFRFMVEKDLILAADVEPMLAVTMERLGVTDAQRTPLTATASTWTQPSVLPGQRPAAGVGGPSGADGKPPAIVLEQDPGSRVWKPADGVQPVYVMVDESQDVRRWIGDLSAGVHALHDALVHAPDVAPAIRLSVLGYADEVANRLPLEMVAPGSQSPWLTARGPASYASAFETLLDNITHDIEALKAQQPKVRRPIVFFLSAGEPSDGRAWVSPYRRLVDRHLHRYAPNIVAAGVGDASPALIASIATDPAFGFVMAPEADVSAAIEQYWRALIQSVIGSARALIEGSAELVISPPAGFRVAAELA
ncbi:vWA domain-containing protein [Micromonospora carbonacea]|uniref:vWA domain-containing protein n=1 Tax=Micromonospora carbonacea TaxID=47853 RepID=UPI003D96B9C9